MVAARVRNSPQNQSIPCAGANLFRRVCRSVCHATPLIPALRHAEAKPVFSGRICGWTSTRLDGARGRRSQVDVEEVVDAMPGIAQNVFAGKVVKFARVHHESNEIDLALL